MSDRSVEAPEINIDTLREAIQQEYAEVAANPGKGFQVLDVRCGARIVNMVGG